MRGVWRASASGKTAPITRGKNLLVVKGSEEVDACDHTGQIRKITKMY
jgi:hypothetical protein